ncbi:MAG: dihydrofolate reductase family protein [Candidatus Heimdallarchaeota archaeon]|nr:MAG: dihydrofolate reductase family protein [Candidatus Heimdallarchaeota archaeon]
MNLVKSPKIRPYVFLSAATSLDGYIATVDGDSLLSNSKDWARVHRLRAESDAIMVGSGTIRTDDSKLTINERLVGARIEKHPIRVVVSSNGSIPLKSRVITHRPDVQTLIATTSQCSLSQTKKLEKRGCKVIKCGNGPLTDLHQLLYIVKTEFNVKKLMVEGGSLLNGALLSNKLVDEIYLAIAPVICGLGIPLFNLSQPIPTFSKSPFFEIKAHSQIDDMIWLKMSIHYQSRQIK